MSLVKGSRPLKPSTAPVILGVFPAPGWSAAFVSDPGPLRVEPLAGWALVRDASEDAGETYPWSEQLVIGLYAGEGNVLEVVDGHGWLFLGYVAPGERAGELYGTMAAERLEKGPPR